MNQENTNQLSPDEIPFEIIISGEIIIPKETENEALSDNENDLPQEDNEVVLPEDTQEILIEEEEKTEEEDNTNVPAENESLILLKELSEKFDQKIAVDAHKNELFDNLYHELEDYKKDTYNKLLKPLILDAIILIDDLNKLLRDIDSTDPVKLFKVLEQIPGDVLEILERNGIEAYTEDNIDSPVNLRAQSVLKTVQTEDPAFDNMVAESVRQGYKWDGSILKKEIVNIYKFRK